MLVLVHRMSGAHRAVGKGSIIVREALGIRQPSWALLGANWSQRATPRQLPPGIHASGADQQRNLPGQGSFRQGRLSVALALWKNDWPLVHRRSGGVLHSQVRRL